MDFGFYMPVRVIGGKDAVLKSKNVFAEFGKRALIVCGGSSAKLCGALADAKNALSEFGIEYKIFDGITQNPKTSDCTLAGETAREFCADFIIGIGGGSQLDAAKAVAVYASNPQIKNDGIYTIPVSNEPLPVLLIGTTAGTGSEVTGVSVLTKENGKKKSVSGKNYYAKVSFADPKYTYSVPYRFTVSTAVDAFSHAAESLFSKKRDANSVIYASDAIPVIWEALEFFAKEKKLPDSEMRNRLYNASLTAGMALNLTGTCYPHTLGYTLTEDYGIPHGFACAAFLPSFIGRAMEYDSEFNDRFFELIGVDYEGFCSVLNSLNDLSEVKMNVFQIDAYCSVWENVKNFANTPGGFTKDDAAGLLKKMFM